MIYEVYFLRNESFNDGLYHELIASFKCDDDAQNFTNEKLNEADVNETYVWLERVK